MTKKCCGKVLGHGLSCTPDYLCDQCLLIEELQTELGTAQKFADKHCTKLLEGWDRDGYDLWWPVPDIYVEEAAYLLSRRILVTQKNGYVAWPERLKEEHEYQTG